MCFGKVTRYRRTGVTIKTTNIVGAIEFQVLSISEPNIPVRLKLMIPVPSHSPNAREFGRLHRENCLEISKFTNCFSVQNKIAVTRMTKQIFRV